MTITRRDLEMLSDDEVRELRSTVTAILDCRRPEPGITANGYEFHHNYAPAHQPKPYVAKLRLAPDGKIERDRFDIPKTGKGVHRITLHGWYEAADFDLIEQEHSQISDGIPVVFGSISIAYAGELVAISWSDNPLPDELLRDYLTGSRAALVPSVRKSLQRWLKHLGPKHESVLFHERLLKALEADC